MDVAPAVPSVVSREPNDISHARFICHVHGYTNHVMGAPGGVVFCIECSAPLARMTYDQHHMGQAS